MNEQEAKRLCALRELVRETFAQTLMVKMCIRDREITMDTTPMYDTGTPSSACMTGQPEPSSESGRPRLMNAR